MVIGIRGLACDWNRRDRGVDRVAALLAALLVSSTLAQSTPTPALSAAEWLARVRDVYQHCPTYTDTGTASQSAERSDGAPSATTTVRFETAFRRPDALRFSARYPIAGQAAEGGAILVIEGNDVQLWNRSPFGEGTIHPRSLAMAFVGAVANSSGVAVDIPPLLLWPSLRGAVRDALELDDPVLLENAAIGDLSCMRIHGGIRPDGRCTLWIDPSTALLRRIERSFKGGFMSGSTTIDIVPSVGQPIPAGAFALNAPTTPQKPSPAAPEPGNGAGGAAPADPRAEANDPAATALLEEVWATYADCRTYRDRGEAVNTFILMGAPKRLTSTFSTTFERPTARWRFLVRGPISLPESPPLAIVVDGDRVSLPGYVGGGHSILPATVLEAVRLGRLMSLGALTDTMPLLLPQLLCDGSGNSTCLRQLRGARRLDDAPRDGVTLARVAGSLGVDGAATLWIDPTTSLIRVIEIAASKSLDGDDSDRGTVITFHPEVNVVLDAEELGAAPTP